MITFLRGTVVEKQPTRVVIDVGGVGYEVSIPLSSYDRLPAIGEKCLLLTILHVREDAHQLYGFMTEEERSLFGLLTAISGIGPKLALSALSGLSVRDLKASVVEGDIKRICSISGVGKKMAERIVVELRYKLSAGESLEAIAGAGDDGREGEGAALRDAMMALVALGYKQDDARKMVLRVQKMHPDVHDVEQVIKIALSK
jgi:Holliday junction DNA helicase RuvA